MLVLPLAGTARSAKGVPVTAQAAVGIDPAAPRTEPTRGWVIANVVLMQAGWFACVLGAAHGMPWLGTGVTLLVIGFHLWRAPRAADEARLLLAVLAFGAVFDAALLATGTVTLVNGQWAPWFTAHWMLALWALFASSLNVSLRWLKRRWIVGALLGAVAGPMSFAGGSRLGAATLNDPALALGLLAVGWAVAIPVLMGLSDRFDGVGESVKKAGGHV